MTAHYIAFEGAEGSGKSTQAFLLTRHLGERKLRVVATREPGGTGVGAAPVIAARLHRAGAVAIVVAIEPFAFEGNERRQAARCGLGQDGELGQLGLDPRPVILAEHPDLLGQLGGVAPAGLERLQDALRLLRGQHVHRDGGVEANQLASQIAAHAPFGGVVPELASREHLKALPLLVDRAQLLTLTAMEPPSGVI